MKVIAYTALMYGKDFLSYAMTSVSDAVDEYWILYAAEGSHGSRTSIPCPDTRDELYALAAYTAGTKLRWIDGDWNSEGEQRDSIHKLVPDADVVLNVDADEIWSAGMVERVLSAVTEPRHAFVSRWRLPFIHYWRSMYRAVLHDPAFPERVILPQVHGGTTDTLNIGQVVHHMGYAQRSEIVRFKLLTHGHRSEFRRDVDWFRDVFMANRQHDTHPVGSEYWNVEAVDPFALGLPEYMRQHPFAGMDVIP